MSVFSKNAILRGCVDHYCLVCETQLRSEEDAVQHIIKPIHKKNLETASFLDKDSDVLVRKVKKGFFCESCNLFMRTAPKVGLHVAEAVHRENKVTRHFRRAGNGILAFDNVFIGDNAWHGLIDDTCVVCDAEFDNAQIHRTDTWHALNLVLIEINIGSDDNIYRKIDESIFQCLTCNSVCTLNTMVTHFEDAEHKKLYQQCCEAAKTNLIEKNGIIETVKDDKDKKSLENEVAKVAKEEIAKKLKAKKAEKAAEKEPAKDDKFKKSENESPKKECRKSQENDFFKEVTNNTEVEKTADKKPEGEQDGKAKQSSDTENNDKKSGKAAKDGVDLHENKIRIVDSVNEFQKNDIKLDMVDDGAYCRKCSKNVDFDFNVIKNHIDDHKKKAVKPETLKEIKPFPTGSEQKTSTTLFTTSVHKNDVKKQEKERESRASLVDSVRKEDEIEAFTKQHSLTYGKGNNDAFCRLCETKVSASIKNMKEHVNGNRHRSKFAKTTVEKTVNAPTMIPSHAFIDSVAIIEGAFSRNIVINEKYALNGLSFLMITKNGSRRRCQACEVNVPVSEIASHKNTPKHRRAMNDVLVASSEETEFIREIRHNLFHCGYCNQLEATWAAMGSHLKSTAHREAKTAASLSMMKYAPLLAQYKQYRRMRIFRLMVFTRMLMGQMFGDY